MFNRWYHFNITFFAETKKYNSAEERKRVLVFVFVTFCFSSKSVWITNVYDFHFHFKFLYSLHVSSKTSSRKFMLRECRRMRKTWTFQDVVVCISSGHPLEGDEDLKNTEKITKKLARLARYWELRIKILKSNSRSFKKIVKKKKNITSSEASGVKKKKPSSNIFLPTGI